MRRVVPALWICVLVAAVLAASGCDRKKSQMWRATEPRVRSAAAVATAARKARAAGLRKKSKDKDKDKDKGGPVDPAAEHRPKVMEGLRAILQARKAYDKEEEAAQIEALRKVPEPALLRILLDLLDTNPSGLGAPAATVFGSFKDTKHLAPLINALKGTDLFVAEAAAEALGTIGSESAIQFLVKELTKSGRTSVRIAVIKALATIGNKGAVLPLLAALDDKDDDIRRTAAVALGKLGDDRALEPLKKLFAGVTEPAIRLDLVEALMGLKAPEGLPEMAKLLVSESGQVRKKARAILEGHGDRPAVIDAILDVFDAEPPARLDLTQVIVPLVTKGTHREVKLRAKGAKNRIHARAYKQLLERIAAKLRE